MGEVYRAKDTRVEWTVALKVLPEEFFENEDRRARFECAARTLASLNHPGIAVLYSFEEVPGPSSSGATGATRHLLVMELLEGETLRQRLSQGALPVRKAVNLGAQILRGLAAAQESGIVHRDFKPENVILTKDGRAKILDFGLAKRRAIAAGEDTKSPTGRPVAPASSRGARRWVPAASVAVALLAVAGSYAVGQEFPAGKVLCETGGYFSDLRFSPRGDRIAFFEHPFSDDDCGEVAAVDLAGRKTVLSEGYWGEEGLAWSPAGDEVMFSAGTAYNNFRVYAVTLSGKRRIALESAGGLTIHDVRGDGRWLATRDDFFREMPALAPGQARERDLSWLDLSDPVALTADGKTLLFTEESGSVGVNYAVCLRQTDGSPVVRLGEGFAADLSRDGKWALASVPTTPPQLVLYPTGAGEPRRLERGGLVSYETAKFFPADGRSLLVSRSGEVPARVERLDVTTGRPR
jgi:hypothetical protein